ncbi:XRE family transcriptional regulator [Streptomyces sp. NPDC001780]
MADTDTRMDLSRLVRERRAELGLSLRKLADRCIDPKGATGTPLWKFAVINKLERELPVIPPQLPELRALAAGLQLPLHEVQDAAGAQFFGIDTVWHNNRVRAMVRNYEAMSSGDKELLERLMETWLRERSPKPDTE